MDQQIAEVPAISLVDITVLGKFSAIDLGGVTVKHTRTTDEVQGHVSQGQVRSITAPFGQSVTLDHGIITQTYRILLDHFSGIVIGHDPSSHVVNFFRQLIVGCVTIGFVIVRIIKALAVIFLGGDDIRGVDHPDANALTSASINISRIFQCVVWIFCVQATHVLMIQSPPGAYEYFVQFHMV